MDGKYFPLWLPHFYTRTLSFLPVNATISLENSRGDNISSIQSTEETKLSEVVDFPILTFEDLSECVNFTITTPPPNMEPFDFYHFMEVDSSKKGESTSPSHLPPLVGSDFLDLADLDPSLGSEEPSIDIKDLLNQQSSAGGEQQILDLLAQAVQSSEVPQSDQPLTEPQMPVASESSPEPSTSVNNVIVIRPDDINLEALNAGLSAFQALSQDSSNDSFMEPPSGGNPKATPPSKSKRRVYEKGTEEYKQRRERNNIAVRKSRDKTKRAQAETQAKVQELSDENDKLQRKVDLLTKELSVLKGLFSNIGVKLPDQLKDFANK